jgi:hypothetical protein
MHEFSISGLHGWHGIVLGIVAWLAFLVCGRQDVGPGLGLSSSAFWFLLALASAVCVVWLGIGDGVWGGVLLGAIALCLEAWLVRRWWRRRSANGKA